MIVLTNHNQQRHRVTVEMDVADLATLWRVLLLSKAPEAGQSVDAVRADIKECWQETCSEIIATAARKEEEFVRKEEEEARRG